jgi:hypothetical protein
MDAREKLIELAERGGCKHGLGILITHTTKPIPVPYYFCPRCGAITDARAAMDKP